MPALWPSGWNEYPRSDCVPLTRTLFLILARHLSKLTSTFAARDGVAIVTNRALMLAAKCSEEPLRLARNLLHDTILGFNIMKSWHEEPIGHSDTCGIVLGYFDIKTDVKTTLKIDELIVLWCTLLTYYARTAVKSGRSIL